MNVRRTRDLPRERLNVVPRHASTRKRSRDCQARQAPSAPSVVASSGLDGLLLFEALCEACADKLVGWDKPWAAFTPIFRALEHSRALQTLMHRSFANTPELQRLGFAFSELQEAREWADYNPEPRPNFDATRNSPPFTRKRDIHAYRIGGGSRPDFGSPRRRNPPPTCHSSCDEIQKMIAFR
jgi:hypothetical protein